MENINKHLNQLAATLHLTNLDEEKEEYILTQYEEKAIVSNAILDLQQHKTYKLKGLGYTDFQIKEKLKEFNWEELINKDQLLKRCNSNKHCDLWHEKQREKDRIESERKKKELKELWTAKNIFKLMKWTSLNVYGKPLIINEHNKKLITAVCYFLSEDPRLESDLGLSLNKGLLIRGNAGLGKTHVVKCAAENELSPVLILSMVEIADDIKQDGEYEIKMGNRKVIYLDDVGTEEATINHYGTKINYFKNFIEMVYLRNKLFNKLIISTNNSFSEIEERYGFRVRSRVKDMFNIIDVTGKDMRG